MEIEAKLEAPHHLALHQIPAALDAEGLYVTDPGLVYLTDHYLDTEDLHLRQAGWALRVRDLGTRKFVTLKALRAEVDGIAKREEFEERAPDSLRTDWHFPSHTFGGRLQELLAEQPLRRLFMVKQTRNIYTVIGSDKLQLEVSTDSVTWQADENEAKGYFVELELKEGSEDALRGLYLRMREALGWPAPGKSKYDRGLEVAGLISG